MNKYSKKELDVKIEELPFQDFLTSRYSMTARVNAQNTYEYAKKKITCLSSIWLQHAF